MNISHIRQKSSIKKNKHKDNYLFELSKKQ